MASEGKKNMKLLSTMELEKLKNLFVYTDLRRSDSLSPADRRRKEEMVEFLGLLNTFTQIYGAYHQRKSPCMTRADFHDFIPRFTHLIRECVLSHQWPQALQLVQALTAEHDNAGRTMYHVGMASLYQVKEDGAPLIDQFVKHVFHLKKVISVEVYFDYLLYLLKHGNLEEAKGLIQSMKRSTLNQQLITEKRKQALTLFYAYQGLILFAEWKLVILREQDDDMDEDVVSQMMSQGLSSQVARAMADSAIEFLLELKDKEGIWDVFVTSLLEIYNYYGMDARDILETYKRKNPQNPNAHRYLFEFDVRQGFSVESQVNSLKDLIHLDPCNPLALTLVDKLGPACPEAVEVLFDYLDFEHCSNDTEAWSSLASALKHYPDNDELLQTVQKCWETRKDWWPHVKFGDTGKDTDSKKLRKRKRKVMKRLHELG